MTRALIQRWHAGLAGTLATGQFLMGFYWLALVTRAIPNVVHEPSAFGFVMPLGFVISAGIAGYGGYLLLQRRAFTPVTLLMGLYTVGAFAYVYVSFTHNLHG